EYNKLGDYNMVKKMEKAPPGMISPLPIAYLKLRDDSMHRLGIGTTREMKSVITGIFIPSLLHPEYTFTEKINIWRGKVFSANLLRNEMFATDLSAQINALKIPVYFFHGKYDYTCSYDMAKDYLEQFQAPVKGFYTFENSAHSPIFEEPERVMEILQKDVLSGVNYLADN
ncbi:MAG TPA: alpha/beta hydrolase, partial [Bacteroidales bacterium]|nr:alpha/beta hydrolase [Bacteroidales bacterium]